MPNCWISFSMVFDVSTRNWTAGGQRERSTVQCKPSRSKPIREAPPLVSISPADAHDRRDLFCVVVGGYVGWQVKIVKEREAFSAYGRDWFGGNVDSISWLRRRLGDRGFFIVLLPPESSEKLHRQATTLFPKQVSCPL